MATYSYQEVLNQIQLLSIDEQLQLLQDLEALLQQKKVAEPRHSILKLKGLGKEAWKGINVDEYIQQERDSWDR